MKRPREPELADALERAAASLPATRRAGAEALCRKLRQPPLLLVLGPQGEEMAALLSLVEGLAPVRVEALSINCPTAQERHRAPDPDPSDPGQPHRPPPDRSGRNADGPEPLQAALPAPPVAGLAETLAAADLLLICADAPAAWLPGILGACPDALLDHALCALTSADEIAASGRLEPAIAALSAQLGEQAIDIFPLAAARAAEAQRRGDRRALRASGAEALLDRLEKLIALGRDALADAAMMLLLRQGAPLSYPGDQSDRQAAAPPPPPDEPAEAELPGPPALQPGTQRPAEPGEGAVTAGPEAWPALLHSIEGDISALTSALDRVGPADERTLARITFRQICATADRISDGCPPEVGAPLLGDLQAFADTVRLLQAEGGLAAATEALDLLNQIRLEVAGQCPPGGVGA